MQYLFLQIQCTLIINFSKYAMYMMNIEKRRNNVYLPESQTISAAVVLRFPDEKSNILPAKYNILLNVPLENFSGIWKRHHADESFLPGACGLCAGRDLYRVTLAGASIL